MEYQYSAWLPLGVAGDNTRNGGRNFLNGLIIYKRGKLPEPKPGVNEGEKKK